MADVLRRLLDSGKLSDENCEWILNGLAKEFKELQLPSDKEGHHDDGWTSDEEELLDFDPEYIRQVEESDGFDIDCNVRIPECGILPYFVGEGQPPIAIWLYCRFGIHCFNFEKCRNLRYVHIPKYNMELTLTRSYYITVEVEDLADNSAHTLQTSVTRCFPRNDAFVVLFTTICRLKPETPGDGDVHWQLDEKEIDEFYRGCIPSFCSQPKPDDKLRYYEVQEQDISENDWLFLYTEFALLRSCEKLSSYKEFESSLPVEIKTVLVETSEAHREPSMKLKSPNAIFHISFKAKNQHYVSVVRRSTDGKTGHMILELNTWLDDSEL